MATGDDATRPRIPADTSNPIGLIDAANQVIDERGVETLFQPLVHLATGEVVGYEALSRGPEGSPLRSPTDLLRAANAAGRLAELDWLCATAACEAAIAAGLHASMSIFLNFDPRTLLTPCPADLWGLARSAQDRLRIIVEMKEDLLIAHPGRLFDALTHVREIGWGVAIDNAAASPRSLALLPLIHPDVIKLDLHAGGESHLVAATSDGARMYAERTGASILAEGLETADDLLLARAVGADFGQGWLLGHPEALPLSRSVPREVFPLLSAPPMDIASTPFTLAGPVFPAAVAEQRFLQPLADYLADQVDANGPPGLLLMSFPTSAAAAVASSFDRLSELIDRSAYAVVLGPGLQGWNQRHARIAEPPPDEELNSEWNIIVLGPHYCGAFMARELGDKGPVPYRRFEYAITHDRQFVQLAACGFLRRATPTSGSGPTLT